MLLDGTGGATPSNSKRLENSQSRNKLRNSDSGTLRASKEKMYSKILWQPALNSIKVCREHSLEHG